MRVSSFLALACLLAIPAAAGAGLNRSYMVPAYDQCPTSNCNPPTRSSPYTFDSIVLYSSPKPYIAKNKLALVVVVKGLKDAAGTPANVTLTLDTGKSRVTVLGSAGTLNDDSPFIPSAAYPFSVRNGNARFRYDTPDTTPDTGLIVNTLSAPVLYDPDGKPLATTGTQTKP